MPYTLRHFLASPRGRRIGLLLTVNADAAPPAEPLVATPLPGDDVLLPGETIILACFSGWFCSAGDERDMKTKRRRQCQYEPLPSRNRIQMTTKCSLPALG